MTHDRCPNCGELDISLLENGAECPTCRAKWWEGEEGWQMALPLFDEGERA